MFSIPCGTRPVREIAVVLIDRDCRTSRCVRAEWIECGAQCRSSVASCNEVEGILSLAPQRRAIIVCVIYIQYLEDMNMAALKHAKHKRRYAAT